ncbi:hypothetical protein CLU79DRAFT_758414 [Phycomyces nitens]|nr:hypothetical protein CLU79DRAFT_758414 [Phycomyces nitens]
MDSSFSIVITDQELKLRRFLNVIGDPCEKEPRTSRQEESPVRHDSFVRDDERRAYEIEHFIDTEENYVQKLRALVNSIALPLKALAHTRNPILNIFKHATIFVNCEQLLEVNEAFLADIKQLNTNSDYCFGDVCARNMNAFDCYRKYLSGKRGSEELQKKEYAENQAFRSFIVRAKEDPQARALEGTLSALLMEPVQRISRYALQLGVIIKYTPKTHPDWIGLTKAHEKVDDIAKMLEDDLTKLANMLHNLYTSIKDSPCSLINQSRSLVTHLDATEIHRETLKPIRPVTLFLFTDKLMVASRHSHQTKSMEACGMNDDKSTASGSFIPKKLDRIRPNQMLKFKGWVDVEQVELFEGIQDRPDSFVLRVSSAQEQQQQQQQPQDQQSSDSTAYFQKCARLFAAIPPKESRTSLEATYVETCQEFIASFQKTQALSRRYESTDETFSRSWQGLDVYSNFYTPNSYGTAKYRNNIAIAYVEEGSDIDVNSLISQVNTPWIIGLVQSDTKGYRLSLLSKINLAERDLDRTNGSDNGNKENNEFVSVFWYNVIMCERRLRHASGFTLVHDKNTEQELEKRSRSRSRSRSLSRSASVVTLTKIFGSRSRSTSPSRSQVSLSSSLSSPLVHNVAPPKKRNSFGPIIRPQSHRPRAKSLSVDSTPIVKPRPQSQIIQKTSEPSEPNEPSVSDLQPYDLVKRQENGGKRNSKVILDLSLKRRSMPENHWAANPSIQKRPSEATVDYSQTHEKRSLGDMDIINDIHSRPSSRSSTTSTVSSNQHTNHSYTHSSFNTLSSLTSQSTRSSLSLEDLEITKDIRTPNYFNASTLFSDPVDNDDYASQVHEKYMTQKRTNSNDKITRKFLQERPLLATIVPQKANSSQNAVHQLTKDMNASLCKLIERCNDMELQARRVTDQIQPSTEGDVLQDICKELRSDTYAMYHHLNTKLGDILGILETNAQQPTSASIQTPPSDEDSKEKMDTVLSQRDYWYRRANELNQQLIESRK